MAYSDFKLREIQQLAGLKEVLMPMFDRKILQIIQPSAWLTETIQKSHNMLPKSEKARSELIIMPILLEMMDLNRDKFTVFSGENLDADANNGLNGECDFILSKGKKSYTIQAPIFALVEAKQHIIDNSLGQCVAQMLGAQIFNVQNEQPTDMIYGCVTNGSEWQFLRLENKTLTIDENRYFFNELPVLLGVMQGILNQII